ncbi:MAG TPA: hypothetical protein VK822_23610 [Acetobacteraceae bacterium]|jgi:hypothetical protein|nr:hypothetical protein [Acetobacteraceae bacterium]
MRDDNGPIPQEISMSDPVPITLTIGQWNLVLQLIAKGTWDVADPLMRSVRGQIGKAIAARPMPQQLGPE